MSKYAEYHFTKPDELVIEYLAENALPPNRCSDGPKGHDASTKTNQSFDTTTHVDKQATIQRLVDWNDPKSSAFCPTVFTTLNQEHLPAGVQCNIILPYTRLASRIARHPTDVVFVTHVLLYLVVHVPSAILLFRNFNYIHALAHAIFTGWSAGPYTLMLHNHIHNNGIFNKNWSWLDFTFPYLTQPLMGHTWDSYFYHHVKHHHVENNGPDDLSSTIRYQRDSFLHFLHYYLRFTLLIGLELPLYFYRKGKQRLAIRSALSEAVSISWIIFMTIWINWKASLVTLIIPFIAMRLGMMIGNWGQHAFVDELEPDSSFRSSITLIDKVSNRDCFNDGYHTSHHLNPRRHWREHPVHFVQSKDIYSEEGALVFYGIDYIMISIKLWQKDYAYLAERLIPLGDQASLSPQETADMLRSKTRRFTEDEIQVKFRKCL